MNIEHLASEIRELNDTTDRLEAAIDTIETHLGQVRERDIPAAMASISHTLSGVQEIQANLAGTVHMLAASLHDVSARLTLLERVIDADLPPVANDV